MSAIEAAAARYLAGDRGVGDALGGASGGWYFWLAFLAQLGDAIERAREREGAFCSYPKGELGRLLRDVDAAFGLAATAVAVQQLIDDEDVDLPTTTIADVLQRRIGELT